MTTTVNSTPLTYTVSRTRRLMMFLFCSVVCLFTGSVLEAIVGMGSTARLTICMVVQNIVVFLLPTLATAMIVTRRPAEMLMIDQRPRLVRTLLVVLMVIGVIPLMNVIIEWNENITFPESWASVVEWMRQAESQAAEMTSRLIGGHSVIHLIVAILVVGVLTGIGEEFFFRGGIQRILIGVGMNAHVAIWLTAILFSAVHLQFFGFVPRMLLGAMFGYSMWLTRNLWSAVIAHTLNNTLVVVNTWCTLRNPSSPNIDNIGIEQGSLQLLFVTLSIVITGFAIVGLAKLKATKKG